MRRVRVGNVVEELSKVIVGECTVTKDGWYVWRQYTRAMYKGLRVHNRRSTLTGRNAVDAIISFFNVMVCPFRFPLS